MVESRSLPEDAGKMAKPLDGISELDRSSLAGRRKLKHRRAVFIWMFYYLGKQMLDICGECLDVAYYFENSLTI